jgi:predicted HicB family RNase H-like nuclease
MNLKGGVKLVSNVKRTTIRLPDGLSQRIQQQADKMGISMNAYIIMALTRWKDKKTVA